MFFCCCCRRILATVNSNKGKYVCVCGGVMKNCRKELSFEEEDDERMDDDVDRKKVDDE